MIEFVRALEHLHIRKIGPNEDNNPINLSAKSDELIKLEKSLPCLKTLDVPMVNVSTVHFSSTANKLDRHNHTDRDIGLLSPNFRKAKLLKVTGDFQQLTDCLRSFTCLENL